MRYRVLRYESFRDINHAQWDIMEFFESEEEAQLRFNETDAPSGWEVSLIDMETGTLMGFKP